jgi:hypothetical protein
VTDDTSSGGITRKSEVRSLADLGRDLLGALARAEQLGVRWRNTRFERYARAITAIADSGGSAAQNALKYEATNQAAQLVQAVTLAEAVSRDILAAKLEHVMSGGDLPPPDGTDDGPRNTLFELTVAHQLTSYGFRVQLTADREDARASHPSLPNPLIVECKRPASSTFVGDPEAKKAASKAVLANLKKGREQLEKRLRARHDDHLGMIALAMDRVYGTPNKALSALTAADLMKMARAELAQGARDVKDVDARDRYLKLSPTVSIVALVLVTMGHATEEHVEYALTSMWMLLWGGSKAFRKRFSETFAA